MRESIICIGASMLCMFFVDAMSLVAIIMRS